MNKVRARKETPVTTTQLTSIYLLGKLPGEGNKEVKLRQIPTEQFNTIISVVAGSCSHFLCLTENGEVLACGKGIAGQLGLGIDKRATPTLHPIKFSTPVFIVNITCNFAQCAAITDEGKLYMWGSGHTASWEPKLEESLDKVFVSKCALGGAHAIIIGTPILEPNSKSFIYGFGNNLYGQIALTEDSSEKFTRITRFSQESIVYIACGYYHSAIVTDEGKVYFFGTFLANKKPIKEVISIEPEGHKILSCTCANNQIFLLTEFGKLFRFNDATPDSSEFTNSIKQVEELFGKYVKHIASDTNFSMALVKSSQRQSEVFVTGSPSKFIMGEKMETQDESKFSLCEELASLFILQFACGTCFSIILAGTERLHSHLHEEEPLNTKKHKFEKIPLNFPVRCLNCNRFIFGLRHGTWKCIDCACTVHSKCKKSVPNCYGALQQITPPSIGDQKKSSTSSNKSETNSGTSLIEEQEAQVLMLWVKAQSDFAQDFVKHISIEGEVKEKKI